MEELLCLKGRFCGAFHGSSIAVTSIQRAVHSLDVKLSEIADGGAEHGAGVGRALLHWMFKRQYQRGVSWRAFLMCVNLVSQSSVEDGLEVRISFSVMLDKQHARSPKSLAYMRRTRSLQLQ